jgi:hypothetical protein
MLKKLLISGFLVFIVFISFSVVLSQSTPVLQERQSFYDTEDYIVSEYPQILASGQHVSSSNPPLLEETLYLNLTVTTIELSFDLSVNEEFLAIDGASQSFVLRVDYAVYFPNGTLFGDCIR